MEVDIDLVISHEQYGASSGMDNDIMLLKLSQPVDLNEGVSPVCLPDASDYNPGQHCYTTGWGNTECKSFTVNVVNLL